MAFDLGGSPAAFSGAVLAGGRAVRMGRDKGSLCLGGRTLLQLQAEKLAALGLEDILLSGAACSPLPGARVVPDEYRDRGPLGGLHACLGAAKRPACLVIAVDAPLAPPEALAMLCRAHTGGVTVLYGAGREQPLIGVYDRWVREEIAALLEAGRCAVRALRERVPWKAVPWTGPEELLLNCNTPEDFAAAARLAGDGGHRCRTTL